MLEADVLPSLLAVAAFLPPSFYLWSVASFDRRAEPPSAVIGTFALGALAAYLLNALIAPFAAATDWGDDALTATLLRTTLIVSLPEELAKFLVLFLFSRRFIAFDHPMEGIVYGAAVGLGFAAVENVPYLLLHLDRWTSVAFVRSVVTVPVHGALGVIAGLYVARARFGGALRGRTGSWYRGRSYLAAALVPIVLHALYDFPFALTHASDEPPEQVVTALKALGLLVGLGIFSTGMSLTFRVAATQNPAFEPHCLSPYLLRAPWRLFVLGSLTGLLGLLMLAAEAAALLAGSELSIRRGMMAGAGAALVLLTVVLHRQARNQQLQSRNRVDVDRFN